MHVKAKSAPRHAQDARDPAEEPEDPDAPPAITKLPLHRRVLYAIYVNRCLKEWQDPNPPAPLPKGEGKGRGKGKGKGPRVPFCPPPFILTPMAGSATHFIMIDTRVLHGVCMAEHGVCMAEHAAYSHWDSVFKVGKLADRGFVFNRRILTDGVSVCVQDTRSLDYNPPGPSGSSPAAAGPSGSSNKRQPADIGSGLADERAFQFDPATQMGIGLDPGAIQAVSAASGVWDEDGCLDSFIRSKLTRSQVQHDSGLIQARQNTQSGTLATWDAVWEEYRHPKRAEQKMRLHGAQEKVLERYLKELKEEAAIESQKWWGTHKQLVVFFGNAGIGTRGGWGAKAVLQACRKVVERANSGKPTDRVPGKVVTVDEFRTSSAMNSPQPCEAELDRSKPTRLTGWKPQPGQVQNRLSRSAWSKRFEAEVRGLMWCPQLHQATPGDLGKWVNRDCNAALNLQRAGESKWRPLELCRWPQRARLPAQGREYPALGYKVLRDRAPKALAQQPVAQ
ncbi:hypothetical protein QJQ45_012530 [Haematococcus lacustris]|nr:hypothetical protein QJQ45_012530 [Haematococcus lacustris]